MHKFKTKSFHIGECCYGGTLKISKSDNIIVVYVKKYKTNKTLEVRSFIIDSQLYFNISEYLYNLTTPYYTDKIINFIKGE